MSKPNWTPIQIRLGDLIPWGDNPKYSTKEDAKRLLETEAEFGQFQTFAVSPFIEGGKVNCYDGHQRDSAWRTAKGDDFTVWALQADRHLTEAERRKFVLQAHNAHGQWSSDVLAGWSADELKSGWFDSTTLKTWKADVTWLGEFLKSEAPAVDAEPQEDRAAELLEKWQVKTGDLWQIGEHRLICGDCTDATVVARVMDGEKAQATITDPPYGVDLDYADYQDTEENWFALMDKVIPVMLEYSEMSIFPCGQIARLEWYYKNHKPTWLIAWYKGSTGHRSAIGFNDFEPLIVYGRGKGVTMHDYLDIRPREKMGEFGHPCPKPVEWAEWLIERATQNDGLVFEPFSGSGTTLVACENLKRKCRAVEISPAYVAVVLERMSQAFPELEIRRSS